MSARPGSVAAATEFVRGLAACHQVAALYPDEHPEYRDRATRAAVAGRDLHDQGEDLPLFLVRGGCYLGPTLLAQASLQHEPLLAAAAEVGLVSVEVLEPPAETDVQQLLAVVTGASPLATPLRTLRVNHVMPAVHGIDTAGLVRGAAAQLATAFMRSTLDALAGGGRLDGDAVRTVGDRLASETTAQPAGALLTAALPGPGDDHLAAKSVKVARLVPLLARVMRWMPGPPAELALAGLLHDVGMATIDREIRDAPGPLSPAGRRLLEAHPVEGAGLLLEADLPGTVVEAALHHHRGVDGSGYPAHASEPTPIGRIVAVVDRYAALTTRRPYRAASLPVEALQRIQSAPDLDRQVVAAFGRLLGAYPPGSLIRLDTGEIALVVTANRRLPTQPAVRVILGPDGEPVTPERRDLAEWGEMGFRWDVTEVVDPDAVGVDLGPLVRRGDAGTALAADAGASGAVGGR